MPVDVIGIFITVMATVLALVMIMILDVASVLARFMPGFVITLVLMVMSSVWVMFGVMLMSLFVVVFLTPEAPGFGARPFVLVGLLGLPIQGVWGLGRWLQSYSLRLLMLPKVPVVMRVPSWLFLLVAPLISVIFMCTVTFSLKFRTRLASAEASR